MLTSLTGNELTKLQKSKYGNRTSEKVIFKQFDNAHIFSVLSTVLSWNTLNVQKNLSSQSDNCGKQWHAEEKNH